MAQIRMYKVSKTPFDWLFMILMSVLPSDLTPEERTKILSDLDSLAEANGGSLNRKEVPTTVKTDTDYLLASFEGGNIQGDVRYHTQNPGGCRRGSFPGYLEVDVQVPDESHSRIKKQLKNIL